MATTRIDALLGHPLRWAASAVVSASLVSCAVAGPGGATGSTSVGGSPPPPSRPVAALGHAVTVDPGMRVSVAMAPEDATPRLPGVQEIILTVTNTGAGPVSLGTVDLVVDGEEGEQGLDVGWGTTGGGLGVSLAASETGRRGFSLSRSRKDSRRCEVAVLIGPHKVLFDAASVKGRLIPCGATA